MKYLSEDIIKELADLTEEQIAYLHREILTLSDEDLSWKPGKYRWNMLEVVEHLNRFGEFYYPKIGSAISYPKSIRREDHYKSSLLGEFAFKRTRPVDGVVPYKAKAMRSTTPFLRVLDRSVIEDHLGQQRKFLNLLGEAKDVNLSKNYIPTMLGKWVRLNLGDSLRILGYHTERHYIQIDHLVHQRID